MITIDRRSIVLTDRGLKSAASLRNGDAVAAVLSGQECFVSLREVTDAGVPHPMLQIFTDAGDVIVSPSTRLISTGGPTSVGEIWSARMEADIGRMSGFTVPLETYSVQRLREQLGDEVAERSLDRLLDSLALVRKGSGERWIRVRQVRASAAKEAFISLGLAIGTVRHGPAGWSWISVRKGPLTNGSLRAKMVADLAQALLISSEGDDERIAVDDAEYRWMLRENARMQDVAAKAHWNPIYAPVAVAYSATSEQDSAFVRVASISRASDCGARGLVLSQKQAYMMLHGHLLHGVD